VPTVKKNLLISLLIWLSISACSTVGLRGASLLKNGFTDRSNDQNAANGGQIYFTAVDQSGKHIPYRGGPAFGGMMMGQYLTCASCHGTDAHGGTHFMHMQEMDAPAINYESLNRMIAEESGSTPQPDGYRLEDFRKAVIEGEHPDGDQLDIDMPRWQMSDKDLMDLLSFLKTLP
jgi:cytochrome c oxidase subunit 2